MPNDTADSTGTKRPMVDAQADAWVQLALSDGLSDWWSSAPYRLQGHLWVNPKGHVPHGHLRITGWRPWESPVDAAVARP